MRELLGYVKMLSSRLFLVHSTCLLPWCQGLNWVWNTLTVHTIMEVTPHYPFTGKT